MRNAEPNAKAGGSGTFEEHLFVTLYLATGQRSTTCVTIQARWSAWLRDAENEAKTEAIETSLQGGFRGV